MLSETQKEQSEKDLHDFLAERHPDGLAYKTKDSAGKWSIAEVYPKLLRFGQLYIEKYNGGFSSKSAFSIVLDELVKSGECVPLEDEQPKIPADILEFIQKAESGKISTYELRRKYMSDRRFRDFYDVHTGLASLATPQTITLTADEYHRIPARTAQMRYQKDPAFKAAVDTLFSAGRV